MTIDHAAEVARIEAERAKLPKDERQRLEAADAPLLRIQLLHMLERAKKAEAVIECVQALCAELPPNMPDPIETAIAHTAGWNDAMDRVSQALAVRDIEQDGHVYLFTGCLHGEHGYCQSHTGLSGAKTPAVCKFCKGPCQCCA